MGMTEQNLAADNHEHGGDIPLNEGIRVKCHQLVSGVVDVLVPGTCSCCTRVGVVCLPVLVEIDSFDIDLRHFVTRLTGMLDCEICCS